MASLFGDEDLSRRAEDAANLLELRAAERALAEIVR